jgi:predicted Zn-dependent protease
MKVKTLRMHLLLATALLVSSAFAANAQAPGSSRNGGLPSGEGNVMLQGRIYFPSGQTASGRTIRVSLESASAFGGGNSAVPDQDGVFRFQGLVPGNYTVVVDAGSEFEKAREAVGIFAGTSRVVQVSIQLQPKVDSANPLFAGVPSNALNFFQKGTVAARKGDAKAAAESFSAAVTAYPNFPIALNELGKQYMILKQWDKAGETYEALLKIKPNDAASHLDLGIVAFNKKKFEDAATHLRKALELNSAGPSAHYYLGLTLISLKRYSEAVPEFEAAIANGGENLALAHKYLGGLYMSQRPKEAADELEKYLKLNPKAEDAERIKGTIKELRDKH